MADEVCYNIGMNKMRNKYKKETALCCQLFYGSTLDNKTALKLPSECYKTASVAAAGNIRVLGNDYPGVTTNRNFAANPNVLFVGYGSMAASQVV